jgi:hypothetical protein
MAAEEAGQADEVRKEIESLKAKVVELESKLSKIPTEEDWKTYRKVASYLAGRAVVLEAAPDEVAADAGGGCKTLQRGQRGFYVLVPISPHPVHATVGPVIFGRGFEDLGF